MRFNKIVRYSLVIFPALLLFLTSCGTAVKKDMGPSYRSVLEKWTKEAKVYKNFETHILLAATFKSEEFRDAYIKEYSATYKLDEAGIAKLTGDEKGPLGKYHEILLALHTPITEWSELDKKEPIWSLFLVNDLGERVYPLDMKKIREKEPVLARFFPYLNSWSAAYVVKFPLDVEGAKPFISPETRSIKLVISGAPGMGEVTWTLK